MTLQWLAGLFIRSVVSVGGLWYFLSVPEGQVFSARILQTFGFDETFSLFRYIAFMDFALALVLGLLVSHSVFWLCIVRRKERWPLWGEPALKALDYLWYAGAAVGLVFVAAQAQGEYFSEIRSYREDEIEHHRNGLRSSVERIPAACNQTFVSPAGIASSGYRAAYAAVSEVCDELGGTETNRPKLRIAYLAAYERCDDMSVDYYPPSEGPYYPPDLWAHRPLLDAYSSIVGVCFGEYHISRISEELKEIQPLEEAVAFTNENRLLSGYVYWFALLLAFRLSRTTAEVLETVRITRRVFQSSQSD